MITDKNGKEVQKGDLVNVPCTVVSAYEGQGYDIVVVEPALKVAHVHHTAFGLNSQQLEVVEPPLVLPVDPPAADVAQDPPGDPK